MTSDLPAGTVTFLFTDIEGSTPLWEREPERMRPALAHHNAILRQAVAAHNGHLFKMIGDAIQAAFALPAEALTTALAAQRELEAAVWPTSAPLRVRMGLHTGSAQPAGTDYSSTHTLNRVARIMTAAHGEQIVISEAMAELIRDELPVGVSLRDMGRHRLKGLIQLEHLFQVVVPDLRADFPPLNTLDVSADNLPTQLTTFIGRETEVAEVARLLADGRLTTLTGSGGCGKTRLSIQVAKDVQGDYPHGVWLVELAPLADPALVPRTVASALRLRDDGHRPTQEVLTDYLRSKTLLLVLDNCEHVIAACAQLSQALLSVCPHLRLLASSREALGIAGEAAYRVPSLAVPDTDHLPALETLAGLDAVRLFLERAAAAKPGFALTAQNAPAIVQICRRLDGIPLAIELAAARVKVLSVEQIGARLDNRFQLLTGGSRTALPRQQTLRAMIDWSYSLLSDDERSLLRRLAVFVSSWTLEAAEWVCSGNGLETPAVLDLLTRLVDKSLVVTEDLAGETRYQRLETIRQYSREKFAQTDEVETVRDRHLAYYVQYAALADVQSQSRDRKVWTLRLEAEQDNLRAALEWGLARQPDSALRLVGDLNLFWTAGGYSAEGFRWTQQALERVAALPPPPAADAARRQIAHAKALRGLAWLYVSQGDNRNGQIVGEQSVALYRLGQDRRGLAHALTILAFALEFLGQRAEAEGLLKESASLARAHGDAHVASLALSTLARVTADLHGNLEAAQEYVEEGRRLASAAGLDYLTALLVQMSGVVAWRRHDYAEARGRFEEALVAFQDVGAHFNVILVKSDLAHMERQLGNHTGALELYRDTIVAFRDAGQRGAVAHQLECLAFIAVAQSQFERALRLLGAAQALREQSGTPMTPDEQVDYQRQVTLARGQLNPELAAKTWANGRVLTMDQAIQYAADAYSRMPA